DGGRGRRAAAGVRPITGVPDAVVVEVVGVVEACGGVGAGRGRRVGKAHAAGRALIDRAPVRKRCRRGLVVEGQHGQRGRDRRVDAVTDLYGDVPRREAVVDAEGLELRPG